MSEKRIERDAGSTRAAAVIVASKPFYDYFPGDPASYGGVDCSPAMISTGDVTYVESLIIRLKLACAMPIVVVTGFEGDVVERHLAKMSVVCLYNERWQETSLCEDAFQGLSYINRTCGNCRKIWVSTPLVPTVEVVTLQNMLEQGGDAVIPMYDGCEGEPVLVSREIISDLGPACAGHQGSTFAEILPATACRMTVNDPGTLRRNSVRDSSDPEDLPGNNQGLMPFRVNPKLIIARGKPFFGPGPATLLRLIDDLGNVRMACERMKLSYSKGWQIINLLEEQLGADVIVRRPGGSEGGSSLLTEKGRSLLRAYEALVTESQPLINDLFERIFHSFFENLQDKPM